MKSNILKGIFLFFIFYLSFLVFLPKENIYFYILEKLNKHGINVANEKFKSDFFGFTIVSADIFYKGMNAIYMEEIEVSSSLFSLTIEGKNGKIDGLNLDTIELSWSLLDPMNVAILVDSKDLKGRGEYPLNGEVMRIFFTPTEAIAQKYQFLLEQCEKTETGEYKLEYNL